MKEINDIKILEITNKIYKINNIAGLKEYINNEEVAQNNHPAINYAIGDLAISLGDISIAQVYFIKGAEFGFKNSLKYLSDTIYCEAIAQCFAKYAIFCNPDIEKQMTTIWFKFTLFYLDKSIKMYNNEAADSHRSRAMLLTKFNRFIAIDVMDNILVSEQDIWCIVIYDNYSASTIYKKWNDLEESSNRLIKAKEIHKYYLDSFDFNECINHGKTIIEHYCDLLKDDEDLSSEIDFDKE